MQTHAYFHSNLIKPGRVLLMQTLRFLSTDIQNYLQMQKQHHVHSELLNA